MSRPVPSILALPVLALALLAVGDLSPAAWAQTSHTAPLLPPAPAATTPPPSPAPSSSARARTSVQMYKKEGEAQTVCTGDTVVWANPSSHAYHLAGTAYYGKTKRGGYMCQKVADANGYHGVKNDK